MTKMDPARTVRPAPAPLRWAVWCQYALAAFQVLIAVLLYLNWEDTVEGFDGRSFAPTRDAAEGAAAGTLGMHVLMALLYLLFGWKVRAGRRWARVAATILLTYNVIGGIGALLAISDQTPLNPLGMALAVVAIVLLWGPASARAHFARRR